MCGRVVHAGPCEDLQFGRCQECKAVPPATAESPGLDGGTTCLPKRDERVAYCVHCGYRGTPRTMDSTPCAKPVHWWCRAQHIERCLECNRPPPNAFDCGSLRESANDAKQGHGEKFITCHEHGWATNHCRQSELEWRLQNWPMRPCYIFLSLFSFGHSPRNQEEVERSSFWIVDLMGSSIYVKSESVSFHCCW